MLSPAPLIFMVFVLCVTTFTNTGSERYTVNRFLHIPNLSKFVIFAPVFGHISSYAHFEQKRQGGGGGVLSLCMAVVV